MAESADAWNPKSILDPFFHANRDICRPSSPDPVNTGVGKLNIVYSTI